METEQLVLTVILWIATGVITSYLAYRRGRDPGFWFFTGMVLGLIGFFILLVLPPKKEAKFMKLDETKTFFSPDLNEEEATVAPPKEVSVFPKGGWYFATKAREQIGPISWEELQNAYQQKKIDLVWNEGMESWKSLSSMKELQQALDS